MQFPFRLAAILLVSCVSPVVTAQGAPDADEPEVVGTYEDVFQYGGNRYEISADGRFTWWWWSDVGGDQGVPTTVGTWRRVGPPGLLALDSDRKPRVSIQATADPTLDGFLIRVHDEEGVAHQWADVFVGCPDEHDRRHPDEAGEVRIAGCVPTFIRVRSLGYFDAVHVVSGAGDTLWEDADDMARTLEEWGIRAPVSSGPAEANVLEVRLEEEYTFLDGALYYVHEGTLYDLGPGMAWVDP